MIIRTEFHLGATVKTDSFQRIRRVQALDLSSIATVLQALIVTEAGELKWFAAGDLYFKEIP